MSDEIDCALVREAAIKPETVPDRACSVCMGAAWPRGVSMRIDSCAWGEVTICGNCLEQARGIVNRTTREGKNHVAGTGR